MELPPPRTWQRPADLPAPTAAAAIHPPPIEPESQKRASNPGWLVGVMLISLAAVAAVLLFTRGGDDEGTSPNTDAPIAAAVTAVTADTSAASIAPENVPATTPETIPITLAEVSDPTANEPEPTTAAPPSTIPPSTIPPSTTSAVTSGEMPGDVTAVVAAADGTHLVTLAAQNLTLPRPSSISFRADDGSLIFQHVSSWTDRSDLTHIRRVAPNGEAVIVAADTGEFLRLHDVGNGGGNQIQVLYSVQEGTTPEDTRESLYLLDLFSGSTSYLGEIGAWESGTSLLDLAGDIVVGESGEGASTAAFAMDLDGNPVDIAGPLGHDSAYGDCAACPHNYSADRSGLRLAWIETTGLVLADRSGANVTHFEIDGLAGGYGIELALRDGVVIINRQGLAALIVDTRTGNAEVSELPVSGHATFG